MVPLQMWRLCSCYCGDLPWGVPFPVAPLLSKMGVRGARMRHRILIMVCLLQLCDSVTFVVALFFASLFVLFSQSSLIRVDVGSDHFLPLIFLVTWPWVSHVTTPSLGFLKYKAALTSRGRCQGPLAALGEACKALQRSRTISSSFLSSPALFIGFPFCSGFWFLSQWKFPANNENSQLPNREASNN